MYECPVGETRTCSGNPFDPCVDRLVTCAQLEDALAPLVSQSLLDCEGVLHPEGAMVPTCDQMNTAISDAIDNLPPGAHQNLQDCNGVLLPNGTMVPTCTQMNDAIALVTPGQALTDCLGVLLPDGTQMATCTYVDDAIAAIPPDTNQALQDCLGALLPNGTQVVTCATYQPGQALQDCLGALLPDDTQVVTCAAAEAAYLRLDGANGPVTGAIDFDGNDLTGANIGPYTETGAITTGTGAFAFDAAAFNNHVRTLTGNSTFTFTNPPVAGTFVNLTIALIQDGVGGRTATWPASVVWPGGTPPVLTPGAAAADVYTFFTYDAGVTWYGFASGQDFS